MHSRADARHRPRRAEPAQKLSVAQAKRSALVPVHDITRAIRILRGRRVILERDPAAIYGVTTGLLKRAGSAQPRAVSRGCHVTAHAGRARHFDIASCDIKAWA